VKLLEIKVHNDTFWNLVRFIDFDVNSLSKGTAGRLCGGEKGRS